MHLRAQQTTIGTAAATGAREDVPVYEAYRAASYFGSLDILRAFAILAVVWHHTAGHSFDVALGQKGYHGVTLFFAISGFLIVTLLLREKAATGDIAMRGFMIRRALRILPLYFATLLTYVVMVAVLEKDAAARGLFWSNLPAFATFTSNWLVIIDAPRVIFYFAWSLAAEEQFYLVWPWIERAKLGRYFALGVAIAAVAPSPDFVGGLWDAGDPKPLAVAMVTRLPGAMGLGVILAHLLHEPKVFARLAPLIGRRGSAMVLLTALLLVLATKTGLGRLEAPVLDVLCMLLVGAAVIRPDNDLAVLLRVPGLVHIGVVSYGLYLLNMLAANGVQRMLKPLGMDNGVTVFIVTLAVAMAMASLSHATFERRMLGLRKRWLKP